ncbi:MAG: hypothetical protein JXQ93_06005 [Flavobacteriaceae bacterium]
MEQNKNNTQIDVFLKKHIQEMPLESPSTDFTKNVMGILSDEETQKTTLYAPLISKKAGIGILLTLIASVIAVLLIPFQNGGESLLEKVPIDFSFLNKVSVSGMFDGFSVSSTTFYVAVLFSVMMFVQIFYLKGYLNKRVLQ